MNKKQRIDLSYLLWTLLPVAVGALSSLLSMDGMRENAALPQPALQPPPWVFITAWTILYLLMGLGAGLVWNAKPHGWKDALIPFLAQLFLNFLWSPLFFAWKLRLAAFFVLLGMLGLAIWMTVADGLFLLLSILCLLFVRKRKFPLANLFGMLAVTTHALGALLFLPILAGYLSYLIGNIRSNREMEKGYLLKQIGNLLSMLLLPLGVGLVLLYAYLRFGDPMALYRQALGAPGVGFSGLFRWLDAGFDRSLIIGNHTAAALLGEYLPQLVYLVFALLMILFGCGTISTSSVLLMAATVPVIFVTGRVGDTARIVTMTAPFLITLAVNVKKRWADALTTLLLLAMWIACFFAFIAGYAGEIG